TYLKDWIRDGRRRLKRQSKRQSNSARTPPKCSWTGSFITGPNPLSPRGKSTPTDPVNPRALPQSFRASEIASAERQGSRKRPDAGHDQPTKARPFANSEEPRRLFSVRLTCRHGRMSTDIERPRPRIVPRRQIARPFGPYSLVELKKQLEVRTRELAEARVGE